MQSLGIFIKLAPTCAATCSAYHHPPTRSCNSMSLIVICNSIVMCSYRLSRVAAHTLDCAASYMRAVLVLWSQCNMQPSTDTCGAQQELQQGASTSGAGTGDAGGARLGILRGRTPADCARSFAAALSPGGEWKWDDVLMLIGACLHGSITNHHKTHPNVR